MTIRLEVDDVRGRKASIAIGPWWVWSWAGVAGTLVIEAGPVRVVVNTRRMRWKAPA